VACTNYDEVIKRIDAKKIILDSLVAREDKKKAVIKQTP
jgi:hypothetical protein